MEVANGGRERRICEDVFHNSPFRFWMPSPPEKWCVYDQEAHLSGVFEMWTGI
jgi:hypothetical protein